MGVPFSMTGFGRCLEDNPVCRQQWEIRSVNSRYLDIKWKLPRIAKGFEHRLEKIVRRHAKRGRLEISLNFQPGEQYMPKPRFDEQSATSMLEALAEFADKNSLQFDPDLTRLLTVEALWSEPELQSCEIIFHEVEQGLAEALHDWNQSRQAEGEALRDDLLMRVSLMKKWLDQLNSLAPEVYAARKSNFRTKITELLKDYNNVDMGRINQELIIIGDRHDATEELTRLFTHLARLETLLKNADADLGRRIDFILQECFREINTCGNKLLDCEVSEIIVDFKNELEKCREQAMNLE